MCCLFLTSVKMSGVLGVLLWGIGFCVFSAFDNRVLSVRPAKTETGCRLLVPLNALLHKVANDTPAVKLAAYTVRSKSIIALKHYLRRVCIVQWGIKGNTKPTNSFLSLSGRTDRSGCPTLKRRES